MPKTTKQFEEIKDKRRTQILNTAVKLFCEHGLADYSIDDICKKCKISHGLFYHYFDSKEDIQKEILERGRVKREETISTLNDPKLKGIHFLEKFTNVVLNSLRFDYASCYFIYSSYSNFLLSIKTKKIKNENLKEWVMLKRALKEIKDGQRKREVVAGDPLEILISFVSIVVGLSLTKMRNNNKNDFIPSDDVVMNIFYRKKGS
ncbi:MAG: TetR/AcrR family transcriptional regulator [Bacilli bacterium]|jgi:AcrR family transcriptional regulator